MTPDIGSGPTMPWSGLVESAKAKLPDISPGQGALIIGTTAAALGGGALIGAAVSEIGSQPRAAGSSRRSTRKRATTRKASSPRKRSMKRKSAGKARVPKRPRKGSAGARLAREDRSGVVRAKKTWRGQRVHFTSSGQPYVIRKTNAGPGKRKGMAQFVPK